MCTLLECESLLILKSQTTYDVGNLVSDNIHDDRSDEENRIDHSDVQDEGTTIVADEQDQDGHQDQIFIFLFQLCKLNLLFVATFHQHLN